MYSLIQYHKNTLFAVLYLSLLAGCGGPSIAIEKPFRDPLASMVPGQTTRESVHTLLGKPCSGTNFLWPSKYEGNVEVFRASGDAWGWAGFIPVPADGNMTHYALITYDSSGRVSATDWGYVAREDFYMFLYAGKYGYDHVSNTIFPSKDGGGKSDKAWASYMHYASLTRLDNRAAKRIALNRLCRAVERGHPAAFNELGNLFWKKDRHAIGQYILSTIFEEDNVKACLSYSIANDKDQPPWCRDLLTEEEATRVERLFENWQPDQCKR